MSRLSDVKASSPLNKTSMSTFNEYRKCVRTEGRPGNNPLEMESKDAVSDSDSGVILQSGSDSPQSMMKDRYCSFILRKQMLEETLEACLTELKKLCLRESELTGYLPKEYPLAEDEEPPSVRRRVGTTFQLDELAITPTGEDTELDCLERDFTLQLQFVEAAKRLSQEGNLSRPIRNQRKREYKKEQKKLKVIKKAINELNVISDERREQTSNVTEGPGASDDSSLEDDTKQRHSQCSSTEFLAATHQLQRSNSPLLLQQPHRRTPPQTLEGLVLGRYQCNDYDKSPIMDTAWTESNLDKPYERIKRRCSLNSKSSSPAVTPVESVLNDVSPFQHFEMRSSHCQNQNSSSAPSTPEMRGRVQHQTGRYLDASPFAATDQRSRTLNPQRRTPNDTVIVSNNRGNKANENLHMRPYYLSGYAGSEFSSSGSSTLPYIQSPLTYKAAEPRYWQMCNLPANMDASVLPGNGFYQCNPSQPFPRYRAIEHREGNATGHMWESDPNRQYNAVHYFNPPLYRDCHYSDEKNSLPLQRITTSLCRIVRTPSLKEYPNRTLHRDVVSDELQSWHERARQRNGHPHSLDRQGAFRGPRSHSRSREQYMRWPALPLQRHTPHWGRDCAQNQWYMTEESEMASQF